MTSTSFYPGELNHIALPTIDPARSEKFYVEVLGFRVVPRPSFSFDGRWLYREEVGPMIHLIHVATHSAPVGPIQTLGPHFALQCSDIDGLTEALRARDLEYIERNLPDFGYRQIFFRDPDGNLIELGQWPNVHDMVKLHEQQTGEDHR